jgi:PAS domain S-box-containing protein
LISVLYVDDEQGLLDLARVFLEESGEFTVGTSTSALEALALPSFQSYDAIVSDYQMPEMDGIAFLKAVRERFGDIPFILFTGRGREEVVIDAINNGADFYLQKGGEPVAQFAELAHKIRQAVRRRMAELERIRSEEKFSKLFTANPSLETISDLVTGRLIDFNEAFIYATGYTREEVIGKTTLEIGLFVDYRDRERIAEALTHGVKIPNFETRIRTKSGNIRTLNLTGQRIRVGDHDILFTQAVDITDRKRAEEELRAANEQLAASSEELRTQYDELAGHERQIRESEEAITSIFRAAPVGIGLVVNRVIQRVNDLFSEISGYSSEEVIGKNARFLYPDDNEYNRVGEFYHNTTKSRAIDSIEIRWVRKDGTLRDILLFGTAVNPSSPDTGMFFTLLDITAEKKTREELKAAYEKLAAAEEELRSQYGDLAASEQQIRESEERYRSVVDNLPEMICRFSPEGTITFTNETYRQYFLSRLALTDIEGMKIHDVMQKMGDDGLDIVLGSLSPGAPIHEIEREVPGSNGEKCWQRWSIRAIFDKGGIPVEYQVVGQDIMEQKRAEDAFRENQNRLHTVLDNLPDLVLVHRDGIILYVNPILMNVIGKRPEDVLNTHVIDYIPAPYQSRVAGAIRQRTETGREDPYEVEFLSRNGESRAVLIRGTGIDFDGKPAILTVLTDITDLKRAEEALRVSEEKYRSFVENASDIVFSLSLDGITTYVSPNWTEVLGHDVSEIVGKPIRHIHPDDLPRVREFINQVIATGKKAGGIEYRIQHKNGTWQWHTQNISPVRDAEGRIVAIEGICHDITERKKAEEALRASEMQYKRIFDSFVDTYYETDKDGIVRVISPSMYTLTGWKPEELIGNSILNIYFDPADREILLEQLRHVPAVFGFEVMLKKRDGSPLLISANARIRYTASGEPDGILGSIRDITEMVRARKALQESEKKFRHILENLQDAYIRTDREGRLIMVNPSAVRMYGYSSADEMIGLSASALYSDPSERQTMLRILQERGGITDFNGRGLRKDGTLFWISLNVQFITGEDGTVEGTEGIVRDMSDRRAMEQAIREVNKKLNLLSSITRHDVVNQLTVLQGYTQLAARKNTDPVTADFLAKIDATSYKIAGQIEFTKTYQDLGIQNPAWFRLDETIARVSREIVTISATCNALEVYADPMIERVFFNLFDNAIRHGGQVTAIEVRCERAPDGLVIIVEDDGIGIDPDEKEQIFEKGFGKNTGFGLFLAREILALTGITIRETGFVGIGARFEITVPKEMWRSTVG